MSTVSEALSGRLVGWNGLPPDLESSALSNELGAALTPDPQPGVRGGRAFSVLRGTRGSPQIQFEIWTPRGGTVVSSLEFRPPGDADHRAVLDDLGEPELALRSNHFEVGATVRDHVHAGRGITVSVAEPRPGEQADPGEPRLVYVQLFAPTSTQEYVTRVGQSGETLRPYPR